MDPCCVGDTFTAAGDVLHDRFWDCLYANCSEPVVEPSNITNTLGFQVPQTGPSTSRIFDLIRYAVTGNTISSAQSGSRLTEALRPSFSRTRLRPRKRG